MVKSNLMIPFILRSVNVQLFRRYCSVLSDEGVQFETARVFNSIAVFNIINKLLIPLCGTVVAVCIFIANASPNLCLGIWGYEEDMPDELKDKC